MIEIPRWRFEPELVWLRCQSIREYSGNSIEFVVRFECNGEQFLSFVPKRFINLANNGMGACIVADVDGGVLVGIPAETLTSGRRIMVRDAERNAALMPFNGA